MELAKRGIVGLAAALAVLAALALSFSFAPGRALADEVEISITMKVGKTQIVDVNYGMLSNIEPGDSNVATAELLKGSNAIKFTGVGAGNTTIKAWVEDDQTTYKYNVTVEAATYTLTPAASPADGGTASAGKTEGIAEGEAVKIEATPKDGWEFVKWEGAAAIADPAAASTTVTMPASDATVTAMFRKKAEPVPVTTYVVTYDANGGTGSMGKQTADVGATVVLTANAFTRDGYTFAGWNTAKDGSGTAYKDKGEVKLEGDMTLYAQWTKKAATAKSSLAKTGDAVVPAAAIALIAALAVSALFFARRRMG